MADVSQKNDPL